MIPPRLTGSTWLTHYEGKLWPVILCGDETPPKRFLDTRTTPFAVPAILLGRRIYIWVVDNGLQEWDPNKDYLKGLTSFPHADSLDTDTDDVRLEKMRRRGLGQDAKELKGLAYWTNYIEGGSEARKIERGLQGKYQARTIGRKRRCSPDLDDEIEILGVRNGLPSSISPNEYSNKPQQHRRLGGGPLPTPGPTPGKLSQSSASNREVTGGEEDSDDDLMFVRQSRELNDPFVASDDDEELEEEDNDLQIEKTREANLQKIRDKPINLANCTVFVGEEYTPFTVSVHSVRKCTFLDDRKRFDKELGDHIILHEDTNIQSKHFAPIAEYLQTRDFSPRILESDGRQRLDTVVLSEDKDREAQKLAMTYTMAATIQFEAVQLLCVKKLKVLYPLSPQTLLIVAMIVTRADVWGCKAESEVFDWLVDHISGHWWSIADVEIRNLKKVLQGNDALGQRVFQKLAENPEARHAADED